MICTANVAGAADGDWMLIAPYGDHLSPDGSYTQIFGREEADGVVRTWNSVAGIAARVFKNIAHGLGAKFTTPIWDGHPETDKIRWPKEKLMGEITALRTGNDGLEGRIKRGERWTANAGGRTPGPLYASALWWHLPPSGVPRVVHPQLLESVGLVKEPNIAGVPAWTANANPLGSSEPENKNNIMDKSKLIRLLGLAADATDAQIEEALAASTANAALLTTANAARDTAQTQLTTLQGQPRLPGPKMT